MTGVRGLPRRLAAFLSCLALAASACSGGSGSAAPQPGGTRTSSESASDPASGGVVLPKVAPVEQLVRVREYGVGFALPKEWRTLEVNDISADSPMMRRALRQSGLAPEQFVELLSQNGIQTLSMAERDPDDFMPDMAICAALPGGPLTDDQVKQRFSSAGAGLGPLRHITTQVGEGTAVTYAVLEDRTLIYGQFLALDLGGAAISITVLSANRSRPFTVEQQIERTLQRLSVRG